MPAMSSHKTTITMATRTLRWFLVLVLLHRTCSFNLYWEDEKAAELHPIDVNLFVGDAMQIYGALLDERENISDVSFMMDINGAEFELPTKVLNKTHVVATLKAYETMKGRTTVSLINEYKEELGSIMVSVLDPLKNVTNVSSIWHYSEKTINVKWDLGVEYDYPVEVETKWIANSISDFGINNCSFSNRTSCTLDDFHFNSIVYFHVTVKVKPFWWNIYLENQKYFLTPPINEFPHLIYKVIPKTKVKPTRPINFKIKGATSQCFNISWENPAVFYELFRDNVVYLITFVNQDGELTKTQESSLQSNQYGKIVTICDLDPNTFYRVHLQVKPPDGGYYSDTVEAMGSTLEDRPKHGPKMTNTSFWLGPCQEQEREMILYWKELKIDEANGVLTNFIVKVNSVEGEVRYSSNHLKYNLACQESYNVTVFSSTSVGITLNPTRITIPAQIDILEPPFPVDLKVEKLTENIETETISVNVSWASTKDWTAASSSVSLVLYYCQGQTFSNYLCIDDFQYKVVPFDKQFVELHNLPLRTDRFGYALERNEDSLRGISWTDCIYDRNETPAQVIGVFAKPGEIPLSIEVMWNAQRCSKDTKALVLLYRIHYCTQSRVCEDEEVQAAGNSSYLALTLKGLDADETYTISVSAVSFSKEGPVSQSVTEKPFRQSVGDGSNISTTGIILIIIFILLAASFVCCCFWKFNRRQQKMRESLSKFTRLHPAFENKDENLGNTDSGISTETLTSSKQAGEDPPYSTIECENKSYETTVDDYSLVQAALQIPNNSASLPFGNNTNIMSLRPKETSGTEGMQPKLVITETDLAEFREGSDVMDKNSSISDHEPVDSTCVSSDPPYVEAVGDGGSSHSSTDTMSSILNEDDFEDPPVIIENIGENLTTLVTFQNTTDRGTHIAKNNEVSPEQCPPSDSKNGALTNKNSSGESSLASLNPNSYVQVTKLENSDTDWSSGEACGDLDDFATNNRKDISSKHLTSKAGDVQTLSVCSIQDSNHKNHSFPDASTASDQSKQNFSNNAHSEIGYVQRIQAHGKSCVSSPEFPDDQPNVGTGDMSDVEPYVRYSDALEGHRLNNSSTTSLPNSSSDGYVSQSDLAKKPPPCERKISEDEGISSPGISILSPNFHAMTRTNIATVGVPGTGMGQASSAFPCNQIVVDVSNLCFSNSIDIDLDNSIAEREDSPRNGDGYTDPNTLEDAIIENSDYI